MAGDCPGTGAKADQCWHFGSMTVTAHGSLELAAEPLWELYEDAFGPLRPKAAARQFLTREEFDEELVDNRITKYVAWQDENPVGLATLTRELATIPWISPEFYQERYPEHAARNAVFYLGFVLVRPELKASRTFHRLMEVVTDLVAVESGVIGYDICHFNNATLRFSQRIESFVHRRQQASFDRVDTQEYYVLDLTEA